MAFARTPTVQKPARKAFADRYMIVPCEAEGDLAVIWDRQEEQVVDVISASYEVAKNVTTGSGELSSTAQALAQGASEQASLAEGISASMEQMRSSVHQSVELRLV